MVDAPSRMPAAERERENERMRGREEERKRERERERERAAKSPRQKKKKKERSINDTGAGRQPCFAALQSILCWFRVICGCEGGAAIPTLVLIEKRGVLQNLATKDQSLKLRSNICQPGNHLLDLRHFLEGHDRFWRWAVKQSLSNGRCVGSSGTA
jgi:hypothetical protein